MKDLLSQLPNDLIWHHCTLLFSDQSHKFSDVWCKIVLGVEKVNNLSRVLTLHILDLASESFHSCLKYLEQLILDLLHLGVVRILQHVETSLHKDLDEILLYLLLIPEILNVRSKNLYEEVERLILHDFDLIQTLRVALLLLMSIATLLCS